MSVFSDANAALFASVLARDVIWRAGGKGAGVSVRGIVSMGDAELAFGDSGIVRPDIACAVQLSEVPSPARNDTIEIDGDVYRVAAPPIKDAEATAALLKLVIDV